MKIISWNLNGLISNIEKNSFDVFYEELPEILCFQETKTNQTPDIIPGYNHHCNNATSKSGYAGTVSLSLDTNILSVSNKISDVEELNHEGRVITLELDDFYIVNTYVPNSANDSLERKDYRIRWDEAYRKHIIKLNSIKSVIACGDFNVTMSAIDAYPENERQQKVEEQFTSDERSNLITLMESGFIDVFRYFYPNKENSYTWWSQRFYKRQKNQGLRLDYFLVSEEIIDRVKSITHYTDIMGSDHCPIGIEVI